MSEQEIAAMEAVLAAAIKYAELTEDATLFLEKYQGKITKEENESMIDDYAESSMRLVAAVRIYKALNKKRHGRSAKHG